MTKSPRPKSCSSSGWDRGDGWGSGWSSHRGPIPKGSGWTGSGSGRAKPKSNEWSAKAKSNDWSAKAKSNDWGSNRGRWKAKPKAPAWTEAPAWKGPPPKAPACKDAPAWKGPPPKPKSPVVVVADDAPATPAVKGPPLPPRDPVAVPLLPPPPAAKTPPKTPPMIPPKSPPKAAPDGGEISGGAPPADTVSDAEDVMWIAQWPLDAVTGAEGSGDAAAGSGDAAAGSSGDAAPGSSGDAAASTSGPPVKPRPELPPATGQPQLDFPQLFNPSLISIEEVTIWERRLKLAPSLESTLEAIRQTGPWEDMGEQSNYKSSQGVAFPLPICLICMMSSWQLVRRPTSEGSLFKLRNSGLLECGHGPFHRACLRRLAQNTHRCPICMHVFSRQWMEALTSHHAHPLPQFHINVNRSSCRSLAATDLREHEEGYGSQSSSDPFPKAPSLGSGDAPAAQNSGDAGPRAGPATEAPSTEAAGTGAPAAEAPVAKAAGVEAPAEVLEAAAAEAAAEAPAEVPPSALEAPAAEAAENSSDIME